MPCGVEQSKARPAAVHGKRPCVLDRPKIQAVSGKSKMYLMMKPMKDDTN